MTAVLIVALVIGVLVLAALNIRTINEVENLVAMLQEAQALTSGLQNNIEELRNCLGGDNA